jgi:hypothetical protein
MTGFVASSSERYSGPLDVEVQLDAAAEATDLAAARLRLFVQALDAGYFFPGSRRGADAEVTTVAPGVLAMRLDVDDLPKTACDVLGGLLLDFGYSQTLAMRSARAILGKEIKDLLVETRRRPAAASQPPFEIDVPDDAEFGNNTLLIEVEFANDVPEGVRDRLVDELALMEGLWLAYPVEDEDEGFEPVESLGAQRHFNDPRTIHHYEFAWDADPISWNLLVNLCCAWSRTILVARLHVE